MPRITLTNHVSPDREGAQRICQRRRLRSRKPEVAKEASLPAVLGMTGVQKVIRDLTKIDGSTLALGSFTSTANGGTTIPTDVILPPVPLNSGA